MADGAGKFGAELEAGGHGVMPAENRGFVRDGVEGGVAFDGVEAIAVEF